MMMDIYKITRKNDEDTTIFAGCGEDINRIFERLWVDSIENEETKCIHGRLTNSCCKNFPKTYENAGILIVKDSGKFYFDYMNQNELTEHIIKNCTELESEKVNICEILHTDNEYEHVMEIPGAEEDEQPWAYEFIECPKTNSGNVRFLDCKKCKHNKDCKAYLNIKEMPQYK